MSPLLTVSALTQLLSLVLIRFDHDASLSLTPALKHRAYSYSTESRATMRGKKKDPSLLSNPHLNYSEGLCSILAMVLTPESGDWSEGSETSMVLVIRTQSNKKMGLRLEG